MQYVGLKPELPGIWFVDLLSCIEECGRNLNHRLVDQAFKDAVNLAGYIVDKLVTLG